MLKPIAVIFLLHSAVRCQFLILEKRGDPPAGFSRIGPTPVDQVLNLRLALTQGNITGLQDTIYEISTPGNPRYGQYLTQDEFVAPSEGTTSLVTSWLDSNGLTSSPITPAGDWISVNLTVSKANEVLGADFSTFQNEDTNQTVVRTLAYSIPTSLKANISCMAHILLLSSQENRNERNGLAAFVGSSLIFVNDLTPIPSSGPIWRRTSLWAACYRVANNPVQILAPVHSLPGGTRSRPAARASDHMHDYGKFSLMGSHSAGGPTQPRYIAHTVGFILLSMCLQELYGIPSALAKPAANVLAVSGFENNFANERDLATFLETFRPDMSPNTTFELISVDGGINNQLPAGSGIAAAPDIQYTVGLATGVSVTFISTGTIPNDFYTEMLDQAHIQYALPAIPRPF
ncbi:Pro-kumamolisin, activation domain-containing protein [Mycena rosella]|uniref:Pro-kumamolisin, activation domain-containing protein n=1 Tax=Mycena rosella TaxID=1033263 RepID=A0AAD7GGV8_MYCRO|nr:Pro-kumamolisin, activation domain-containing protein [Mycena rosella]